MPTAVKKVKKPAASSSAGMSRGRRGMFLRIPPELYEKLLRMTASRFASGERDGIQGTVMRLIEQAKERA